MELLNKITKLAKEFGYKETNDHYDYVTKEEGFYPVKTFIDPKDLYKNTWVHIYIQEDTGQGGVAYYYWSGPSGAWDPLEQWTERETWKKMTKDWD